MQAMLWGCAALTVLIAASGCAKVQEIRETSGKAVELGVIEPSERELGADESVTLQVQALDPDGEPVDGVSVFFVLSDAHSTHRDRLVRRIVITSTESMVISPIGAERRVC